MVEALQQVQVLLGFDDLWHETETHLTVGIASAHLLALSVTLQSRLLVLLNEVLEEVYFVAALVAYGLQAKDLEEID